MDYDHDAHSKYLLMYHMMFVCKYRKQLLSTFGDEIKSIFTTIAEKSEFSNLEMELDKDHIHILVKSVPKISTLQIVRRLKQISTHQIWKSHPFELQRQFWKEHTFWSDGYFVCSIVMLAVKRWKSTFNRKAKIVIHPRN